MRIALDSLTWRTLSNSLSFSEKVLSPSMESEPVTLLLQGGLELAHFQLGLRVSVGWECNYATWHVTSLLSQAFPKSVTDHRSPGTTQLRHYGEQNDSPGRKQCIHRSSLVCLGEGLSPGQSTPASRWRWGLVRWAVVRFTSHQPLLLDY